MSPRRVSTYPYPRFVCFIEQSLVCIIRNISISINIVQELFRLTKSNLFLRNGFLSGTFTAFLCNMNLVYTSCLSLPIFGVLYVLSSFLPLCLIGLCVIDKRYDMMMISMFNKSQRIFVKTHRDIFGSLSHIS